MHSFLPASTESLLLALPQPIALVGNGVPSLCMGQAIDRYASVVRFNNYKLTDYAHLIGTRTSIRVVNGWTDLEARSGVIACTPFREDAPESAHLQTFRASSTVPVLHALTDIHELIPDVPKPSTGLALAVLMSHLGIQADCFGFDSFASGHYWNPGEEYYTTHSSNELHTLMTLPGITVYGRVFDYGSLYNYCHAEHSEYNVNEGASLFSSCGITYPGESIIEFGAGNGGLSQYLEANGSTVKAVEVSTVAFERIPVKDKILGDALTLCTLDGKFDRFVSIEVLEHLVENDVRIVARQAARLANNITITVCTRPSGLKGPNGIDLHLTVRPVRWWLDLFGQWFDLTAAVAQGIGQIMITGTRKNHSVELLPSQPVTPSPKNVDLALPVNYVSRLEPQYFVDSTDVTGDVTWQPDVYSIAERLAETLGAKAVIDIGCGQARKLVKLHPAYKLIGVDYGENIEYCRSTYAFGTWLESNLERTEILPIPEAVLSSSVIVCSDVIERLMDPRPLLSTLSVLLRHSGVAILTTPDRIRTHGEAHLGPPPNPAHTREWSAQELEYLCTSFGLKVMAVGHTRSNDASPGLDTMALLLRRAHRASSHSRQEVPNPDAVMISNARSAGFHHLDLGSSTDQVKVPSAQLKDDGSPRFSIPVEAGDPNLALIVEVERNGGVDAETRAFLDSCVGKADVVLDMFPGYGFVSLSSATAPLGSPRVLTGCVSVDRFLALNQAAKEVGSSIEYLSAVDKPLLSEIVSEALSSDGSVFIHCSSEDIPWILASFQQGQLEDAISAFCVSDAGFSPKWDMAFHSLSRAGYRIMSLIESDDQLHLTPQTGDIEATVIALPANNGRSRECARPQLDVVEDSTLDNSAFDGVSFCIITDGRRPHTLLEEIASIQALGLEKYQIIIAGDIDANLRSQLPKDVVVVDCAQAAHEGRLGAMRNAACHTAEYSLLVVADDDMLFHPDFCETMSYAKEDWNNFDVLCVRLLNPDGSRYWDWAYNGPDGQSLLSYDEHNEWQYVTGGLAILKKEVHRDVEWDKTIGFYEGEDCEWSQRLHAAGKRIRFCKLGTVTHQDSRYTQAGSVVRFQDDLESSRRIMPGVEVSGVYRANIPGSRNACWMSNSAVVTVESGAASSLFHFTMTSVVPGLSETQFDVSLWINGNPAARVDFSGVSNHTIKLNLPPNSQNQVQLSCEHTVPATAVGLDDTRPVSVLLHDFQLEPLAG